VSHPRLRRARFGSGQDGRTISAYGPPLPTCAVHKVISYLRYSRRASRTAAIAVFGPPYRDSGELVRSLRCCCNPLSAAYEVQTMTRYRNLVLHCETSRSSRPRLPRS
jgi:hypothetical protein